MNNLSFASIKDLRSKIEKKEISPAQLLDHCIQEFKTKDPQIGSALEVFDKESIIKQSNSKGSLAGIPGIIKDNIAQLNRRVSCASKILQGFESTFDATAIARLKHEGAFLIGRANCDEFAMGSSTETSAYQKNQKSVECCKSAWWIQWWISCSSCCWSGSMGAWI